MEGAVLIFEAWHVAVLAPVAAAVVAGVVAPVARPVGSVAGAAELVLGTSWAAARLGSLLRWAGAKME